MANNHIRLDDFLILWSQAVGHNTSPSTMRKYLIGFQKVILDELKLNGSIYIDKFGTFRIKQSGGKIKRMGNFQEGEVVNKFIKPKLEVVFDMSAILSRAINENDYEMPKRKSKRRYTNKEYKVKRNEKRRKPKKTMEEIFCEMSNEIDKEKRNG